jgi:hypothetical protein
VASSRSDRVLWSLDPFRSLGPITADLTRLEIEDRLGPMDRELEHDVVAGLFRRHGKVRLSYYDDEPYLEVELLPGADHVVVLNGVQLKGPVSRLEPRLKKLGYLVEEDNEGFRIDPAGTSLWVPEGKRSVAGVAVLLFPSAGSEPASRG